MISPLYGSISPLRVPTKQRKLVDSNAISYIAAVEAADGAKLEDTVSFAYEDFILGCKSDGTWNAIKASCILAGARTLAGALVPLVGPAPTNLNFVSADYNRKTGLLGNGSTKHLNTNVAGNSSNLPQNDVHICVYATTGPTLSATGAYIGNGSVTLAGNLAIFRGAGSSLAFDVNAQNSGSTAYNRQNLTSNPSDWVGFKGVTRNNSNNIQSQNQKQNYTYTNTSATRTAGNVMVFRLGNTANYGNGIYSFYSLGQSLDLALLDTRVSTLMSALAAAIP